MIECKPTEKQYVEIPCGHSSTNPMFSKLWSKITSDWIDETN
jgi:hypothetical protein